MSTDFKADILSAAHRLQSLDPSKSALDDRVRAVADAAVEGAILVHCLGEHRLPTGRANIDWFDSRFHIDASVARFTFLEDLAVAYRAVGEERYAEAARDFLAEYMMAFPPESLGKHRRFDSVLQLGIRNSAWCRTLHLFATSAAFDAAFLDQLVPFIAGQLRYLHDHLSTTINWRVSNARDLLIGGLFLSFLDDAPAWCDYSVRVLNDAWFRQFLPDGAHCERIPSYHANVAETYLYLYRVKCLMPELRLVVTLERLAQIFDVALAYTKPSGYLCGIHDCQTDFTGHVRDQPNTAQERGQRPNLWTRFRNEFDLPMTRPSTSHVLPHAGLAFFRTGWDDDASWMSFDASNWGGGHCHLSRNAVQLHAHRQSMVIDPGWPFYGDPAWSSYGCSTRAHSTCNLNGLNQSPTNPSQIEYHGAPGYNAVLCKYEGGYWDLDRQWDITHAARGIWAEHGRILLWVQDRFAFVADSMFRLPHQPTDPEAERPSCECVWQLAPEARIDIQSDRAIAQWAGAGLLILCPIRPEGSRLELHSGETAPLRGWVPDPLRRWDRNGGTQLPAPQVVINTPHMQRQHDYCVSVLVPYADHATPHVEVESQSPLGQTGYVRLRWDDGTEDAVYWACNFNMMLGKWPDFETDASLVHLRKDANGTVIGGCCVNATYMTPYVATVRDTPCTFTFQCQPAN